MLIQNPDVGSALREEAKLSLSEVSSLSIPSNVQSVIDVTPSKHQKFTIFSTTLATTGSSTVLSAKAGVRYRIHALQVSFIKDATCDGADGRIDWVCTQDGVSKVLCGYPVLTLTAMNQTNYLSFDCPILCDVNTAISTGSYTFTAGKCRRTITLFYSEEQVS